MKSIDEIAADLLAFILEQGGECDAEPGQLIKTLAQETGHTYSQVRVAILYLETADLLQVERHTYDEPKQHNMLVRVAIT